MSNINIIPIFVPHFGCPHDCIFCNQKKITGLSTSVTATDVERIIEEHLGYFKPNSHIEVAFYGGSFTAIDIETQSNLLQIPKQYKDKGIIHEIRCSTRPDAIDNVILTNLKKYGMDTIELGVQSLDKEVLDFSERDHGVDQVYNAVRLIREYDFKLGLQMMLGLPTDSLDKSLKTCIEFIKINPDCVRIYPTLVIKDTFLERLYLDNRYHPLDIDNAVEWSSLLLMLFKLNNINVIRVGLQPTDNIQMGKDVIAGPFHPAFRQLAESRIYRKSFEEYFAKNSLPLNGKELTICANKSQISSIAGQKSINVEYLRDKYKFRKIKIHTNDNAIELIDISIGNFHDIINMNNLMKEQVMNHPLIKNIEGFQI